MDVTDQEQLDERHCQQQQQQRVEDCSLTVTATDAATSTFSRKVI